MIGWIRRYRATRKANLEAARKLGEKITRLVEASKVARDVPDRAAMIASLVIGTSRVRDLGRELSWAGLRASRDAEILREAHASVDELMAIVAGQVLARRLPRCAT